jgi:hypothetical protein
MRAESNPPHMMLWDGAPASHVTTLTVQSMLHDVCRRCGNTTTEFRNKGMVCKMVCQPILCQLCVPSSTEHSQNGGLVGVIRYCYHARPDFTTFENIPWGFTQSKAAGLQYSSSLSTWRLQLYKITSTAEDVTKELATCQSWRWSHIPAGSRNR